MKGQIRDWMSKHPVRIDRHEDIKIAADIMNQEKIHHLVVCDDGQISGILSSNDIELASSIRKRFKSDSAPPKITVGDLMSRYPTTVRDDVIIYDAVKIMIDRHFRSLPVVNEDGTLVGIITQSDVMRFALLAAHQEAPDLTTAKIHEQVRS